MQDCFKSGLNFCAKFSSGEVIKISEFTDEQMNGQTLT